MVAVYFGQIRSCPFSSYSECYLEFVLINFLNFFASGAEFLSFYHPGSIPPSKRDTRFAAALDDDTLDWCKEQSQYLMI